MLKMFRTLIYNGQIYKTMKRGIKNSFSRHLFLTNVTISFSLSGAGDILQQQYRIRCREQQSWDKLRTRNMTCTGVTVGVLCHHWYQILDERLPGRTIKIVMKKLIIDQLFFSPVCILAFISTLSLLRSLSKYIDNENEKKNSGVISQTLKDKYTEFKKDLHEKGWKLYLADWIIWPPAQLINFYYLPTKYRVLYDNTISLLYDIYASHVVYHKNETIKLNVE